MKTFKDLDFKPHSSLLDMKHARIDFENGYGISVILGTSFCYSNGIDTYEVAVMKDGDVCYDTSITNDVLGYQTESEVEEVLRKVQELPKK